MLDFARHIGVTKTSHVAEVNVVLALHDAFG